jgi:hypothetical protein
MITLLKEKGCAEGKDLEYFHDEGVEHNERAWARRGTRVPAYDRGHVSSAGEVT